MQNRYFWFIHAPESPGLRSGYTLSDSEHPVRQQTKTKDADGASENILHFLFPATNTFTLKKGNQGLFNQNGREAPSKSKNKQPLKTNNHETNNPNVHRHGARNCRECGRPSIH